MRVTNGAARHSMIKRMKKRARGYYSGRHKMYRVICEAVRRGDVQAFASRKQKKRVFRQMWIKRVSIACRDLGITYSRLISGLSKADIRLDRKQLSELAIHQPEAFKLVIEQAKKALADGATPIPGAGIKGYFEIKTGGDNRLHYNLKAGNHEIILTGSNLADRAAVDAQIVLVRARCAEESSFKIATASNNEVYFTLTAADGSTIGTSETYPTNDILRKGLDSVKRNGPTTKIVVK